jgi:acyl carrier protein
MIEIIRHAIDTKGNLRVAASLIAPWANLYEMGLTPFAAIQVMLELEKEFSIEFPDDMLKRKSFSSISAILACVKQLRSDESYSDAA